MAATHTAVLVAAAILFGSTTACGVVDPAVNPSVAFKLDAPLCSSILPMQFLVDNVQVGLDTFRVHLNPEHTASRPFSITPGQHTVGARVVNGFVWADTTMSLSDGQAVVRTLPFYCS
jgi:hypothetical protein